MKHLLTGVAMAAALAIAAPVWAQNALPHDPGAPAAARGSAARLMAAPQPIAEVPADGDQPAAADADAEKADASHGDAPQVD